MGVLHFLNVGQGDCSIIQHTTGRITVIDVSKARSPQPSAEALALLLSRSLPPRQPTFLGGSGLLQSPPPDPGFGLRSSPPPNLGLGGLGSTLFAPPTRGGSILLGGGTPTTGAGSSAFAQALRGSKAPAYENPIRYMRDRGITNVFRFILTHPDMDHMDGILDLFAEFAPANFWDTENTCTKSFQAGSPYKEEDWRFYIGLRDGTRSSTAKRLALYAGAQGPFYNQSGENNEPLDGLSILAPTPSLVADANRTEDFNDASYVILYRSAAGRILFCGDAHDKTWEHLLANHLAAIQGVELMIAPHHGRDSGRDRNFLSAVRPRLTLFGVAPSEHLAYDAWRNRDLTYITSNQAGTIVVDTNGAQMKVYVAKESLARERNPWTFYSTQFRVWTSSCYFNTR